MEVNKKCLDCMDSSIVISDFATRCLRCAKIRQLKKSKEWRLNNKGRYEYKYSKAKARAHKKWRQENKDKVREYGRLRYYKYDKDRLLIKQQEEVQTLSDKYIVKLLTDNRNNVIPLEVSQIPSDLIAIKRRQVKLHRLIKNSQEGESKQVPSN